MKRAPFLILAFALPIVALAAPAPKDQLAHWGKPFDPAKDCKFEVKDGKLKITVPGGKEPHDLSAELNAPMEAPRVLKEIEGDFQMEVNVAAFAVPEGTAGGTERNVAFWGAGFLNCANAANAESSASSDFVLELSSTVRSGCRPALVM